MENILLSAKNISKSFDGVHALKNVSVEIEKGKIKCLAGENGCGKSTLVKILSGVYTPDKGEINIEGRSYSRLTPITAIEEGIQVIYQDLSLFLHMSIAENIAMNKMLYSKNTFMDWNDIYSIAQEQLDKIGASLDLDTPIRNLSIANRQLVAICRALSLDAKVLFMDEPTTALTKKEVDRLLSIVLGLKEKGISVVFISHKLNEIFQISDSITVIRDGEKVGDFTADELNPKSLSYYMTGKEIGYSRYIRKESDDNKILEVKNLSKKGMFENINFSLRKGDILGITGLLGSGRTEIALSLFGLNPPDSGDILIDNKPLKIDSPTTAIKHGIALLPEDRLTQGLFLESSAKFNITATILDEIKNDFGIIDRTKQKIISTEVVNNMNVNNKDIDLHVKKLSGGNQQKIAIGKWMVTAPNIFILDTPTVGVDIGSKSEIYNKIQEHANNGMGIILISDEIEEVLGNCNKVIIMHEGKIIKYLDETDLDNENIQEEIFQIINNPLRRIEDE
ncbi:sugar ABC transporter ATP-binding protein [Tissierella praeacuta]|uniref:sugar ABC transporter ATP-binding protein n=1 Tax=Tissierella praeacuta TaxID=43131 RepID=UPI001C1151C8|nr:sugar ABC transporter ATP-binding protein [Tissierella praeacuta]MBU5255561.1 sugar ABC transporter ATP-binding protein [Tissierella praeacuta]